MAPYLTSSFPETNGSFPSDWPSRKPFDGKDTSHDVAIIGLSFQFPGAESSDALWELMATGKCVASQFPSDRISATRYHVVDDSRPGTVRISRH